MTANSESVVQNPHPGWWALVQHQMAACMTAVRFLTRIPVPDRFFPANADPALLMRASVIYFPLVGAGIGAFTGSLILIAARFWSAWLAVLIGVALEAMLTGALHEDAVADFCDAFGGGWTREDVLRILKDSRIGSFGVLGLTLAVGMRAGSLIALIPDQLLAACIASATLGRLTIICVMAMLPPVAGRISLARDVGERITSKEVVCGSLLALPGVIAWAVYNPDCFAIALAVLLFFVVGFVHYVRGRLGGVTGDCLGFACYAGQLVVLLIASARWS